MFKHGYLRLLFLICSLRSCLKANRAFLALLKSKRYTPGREEVNVSMTMNINISSEPTTIKFSGPQTMVRGDWNAS